MSKSTDKTGKTAVTKAVTKDVNMDLSIGTRVDVKGGTHDGKTGTIKKVNDQKPRVLLDDHGDLQALFVGQTPTAGSDAARTAAYVAAPRNRTDTSDSR